MSIKSTKPRYHDTLGRPLLDLRLSVIDTCNFRCDYCMPAGQEFPTVNPADRLTFEEINRLGRIFCHLGIRKIRITGGEPLLRSRLEELIANLKKFPCFEDVSLTTNGFLLAEKAQGLKDAGLDRITVSLDTLDPDLFRRTTGRNVDINKVLNGIEVAAKVGLSPIKINVVVRRGVNDSHIPDIVAFCREKGYVARFIEFMDVGNQNRWDSTLVVPSSEVVKAIHSRFPMEPADPNYFGEVAERYRFLDGNGEVGFISSVSQPFCRDCTRARVSVEGILFTCLFASVGTDLRTPMRSGATDEELFQLVLDTWESRNDRYSEERSELIQKHRIRNKVEMFRIGG